jgi:hypothetical protein
VHNHVCTIVGAVLVVVAAVLAPVPPAHAADTAPAYQHVWVHYDYLVGPDGRTTAPDPEGIAMVVQAFAAHGIVLHIDPHHTAIALREPWLRFDPEAFGPSCDTANSVTFADIKAHYYSPPDAIHQWHYGLFADLMCTYGGSEGGEATIGGDDLAVATGFIASPHLRIDEPWHSAGTFMHELGHDLGLRHGGDEDKNGKPNYISVMNYDFQSGIYSGAQARSTVPVSRRLDYSGAALGSLDETHLDERVGIGAGTSDLSVFVTSDSKPRPVVASASGPVDWNADGVISPDVSEGVAQGALGASCDILGVDNCPPLGILTGFDDWSEIRSFLAHQPPPGPVTLAQPVIAGVGPQTGPVTGGTQVTISGSDLRGATGVLFGGAPAASFQVIDDHTIAAVAPDVSATPGCGRGAGQVDLSVAVNDRLSPPSPADLYTYANTLPHQSASCVLAVSPNFGGTGDPVTIKGWGLSATTAVYFDGQPSLVEVPAAVRVVDDNTLAVTVPSHGFDYNATLTVVANGAILPDASPALEFAYTRAHLPPAPTLESISPHHGPAAGGTSVTIHGSGFTDATGVFFQTPLGLGFASGKAASFRVVDDSTIIAADEPEQQFQTAHVRVVTPGGVTPLGGDDFFSYDTAVAIPPPPSIDSVTPNASPTAGGTLVTISGTGLSGVTTLQVGTTLLRLANGDFSVLDDHTLRFTTPPAPAGTVDVIARVPQTPPMLAPEYSQISPAEQLTYH